MSTPHVEIFETTLRDGSYAVDFQFTPQDVAHLCSRLEKIGFRYIEVGHGLGLNASHSRGASAATDDEYLEAASNSLSVAKFGTFFIPGIGNKEHLRRAREEYGMHFIRIGSDADKIEKTFEYLEYAKELGFQVMSNLMKSYEITASEMGLKARELQTHGADIVYVVDSAGGMLPGEVGQYVRAITENSDVRIGFHGHNNLELAVANSIAAFQNGCTLLDCSIGGLGRSAGNTKTELMILALKRMGVPVDYDFEGVLEVLDNVISPVLRNRFLGPVHAIGGFARVHSGMMKPFIEVAQKNEIDLKQLLYQFGETANPKECALEEIARQIKRPPITTTKKTEKDGSLLRLQHPEADFFCIQNSGGSLERLLSAVKSLAKKANIPVVAVIDLGEVPDDETYLFANYLYHDNQFVVVRILASDVSSFANFMQKYRGFFNTVIFESLSEKHHLALGKDKQHWHDKENILYVSRFQLAYRLLFSTIYALSQASGSKAILFFGGSKERLQDFITPDMEHLNFFIAEAEPNLINNAAQSKPRIQRLSRIEIARHRFDVIVLLVPIDAEDLAGLVELMNSSGIFLDCVNQVPSDFHLLNAKRSRLINLDLNRSLSGELTNLQGTVLPAESRSSGDDI